MTGNSTAALSRRDLLKMIGLTAGGAVMYQAMSSLGMAAESTYQAPPKLGAAPRGASVLVLGAGIAGMVAAYELRQAGYKVQVLEYNQRAGGRNWTVRGGDTYTELGGATQHCGFDPGLYINPGPWRIPYHHYGILSYCKKLGVPLEAFVQVNYNAYLHNSKGFDGKPRRFREVNADYRGHVSELLAKSTQAAKLDAAVTKEDQAMLLASLRKWGALDKNYAYAPGELSSNRRGYAKEPGGGVGGKPTPSTPMAFSDLLQSGLWADLATGENYEMQTTLFQPVGGMGRIGDAFARELKGVIHYGAKVTGIHQDDHGVSVTYVDDGNAGAVPRVATADWCVNTIPLSILGQLPMNVGAKMAEAIAAVPYAASVKVGLQFKRRFWEEDEHIFGGISYTDLPIRNISYPSTGYHGGGKGVLLGGYLWGLDAFEFTAMPPAERVRKAVAYGAQVHHQYNEEFDNGFAMAWHRSPFTQGCFGTWTEAAREQHYANLVAIDNRIVLAGEHASYVPAWQEGAVLSALDAIERLHARAVAGARA
jgi:monoamine oxidase